jgi:hypothetical protein
MQLFLKKGLINSNVSLNFQLISCILICGLPDLKAGDHFKESHPEDKGGRISSKKRKFLPGAYQ